GAIKVYRREGDFMYTEIPNDDGEVLKGWLLKKDLMSEKDWEKKHAGTSSTPEVSAQVAAQLQTARLFLDTNKLPEALIIYNSLSAKGVPEAMYYYAR